ncbi:MAG TPA: ribosome maturation factor RimM [Solirubrobacteraceae bacterium]|nr:ribosome maturation factor RimM [Solirubrobacteraceae bacterium]
MTDPHRWLRAGTAGRPHGLDGSFYVADPVPELLDNGAVLHVGGIERSVIRRAGTDARPIIRLSGCADRDGALALRGQELLVLRDRAPELGADEWWADELEGCTVRDGTVEVGTVTRMVALPSCEVLEVARPQGGETPLLIPLVSDAVRSVDVAARLIDVDLRFLGEA